MNQPTPPHPDPRTPASAAATTDDAIAAMLLDGATYNEIATALGAGRHRIAAVRHTRQIPVPPGRAGNTHTPADRAAVVAMLRHGATIAEIRARHHISPNTITELRRTHRIPYQPRPVPTRTISEALALYTEPYDDGHLRWTGPTRGRTELLWADGRPHTARHITFRHHWHRDPIGYACTTCTEPGCIAGPHLADHLTRTTQRHSRTEAIAHLIATGLSDWEIVRRLNTSTHAIGRIRTHLTGAST